MVLVGCGVALPQDDPGLGMLRSCSGAGSPWFWWTARSLWHGATVVLACAPVPARGGRGFGGLRDCSGPGRPWSWHAVRLLRRGSGRGLDPAVSGPALGWNPILRAHPPPSLCAVWRAPKRARPEAPAAGACRAAIAFARSQWVNVRHLPKKATPPNRPRWHTGLRDSAHQRQSAGRFGQCGCHRDRGWVCSVHCVRWARRAAALQS